MALACTLLLGLSPASALGQSAPDDRGSAERPDVRNGLGGGEDRKTPPADSADENPADEESAGSGMQWLPERNSFAPLLASPSEVQLGTSLLYADRPYIHDFEGGNLEARVTLGHRLRVLRIRGETSGAPSVHLGLEFGVASRFSMSTPQADLINSDFRVGLPLSLGYDGWQVRFTPVHVSSHFGDEFVYRFPRAVLQQVARDGFELTVAREMRPGVRVYVGGDYNLHVTRTVEKSALRLGVEWDPAPGNPGGARSVLIWPYAGANLATTSLTRRVASTVIAGLGFRVRELVLRLEAIAHRGPSPMGRLRTAQEEFLGLGLRVEP